MTSTITQSETDRKEFEPGTTGWTADDLEDPEIEVLWGAGRYEIVEGVLTLMPPAYFDGTAALQNLIFLLQLYVRDHGQGGQFGPEADFIVSGKRVARPDAAYLSPTDLARQEELHARRVRRPKFKYGRLLVPPTLIIESLSQGHEAHDRETKWHWYAEFGVPNYWIMDPLARTLECYLLRDGQYQLDVSGKQGDEVRPSLFPGLIIPLAKVWL